MGKATRPSGLKRGDIVTNGSNLPQCPPPSSVRPLKPRKKADNSPRLITHNGDEGISAGACVWNLCKLLKMCEEKKREIEERERERVAPDVTSAERCTLWKEGQKAVITSWSQGHGTHTLLRSNVISSVAVVWSKSWWVSKVGGEREGSEMCSTRYKTKYN